MIKRRLLLAVSLASMMSLSQVAAAATATATFQVSLTLTSGCTITANNLTFPNNVASFQTAIPGQTTVTARCTLGNAYSISLDQGTTTGSTTANRLLAGTITPANTVAFNLYQDSSFTQPWGKSIGTDTKPGTGDGSAQAYTVYGQVPVPATVPAADTYKTTITATITF